jgi:Ca-activated chloride channel family protein
MLVTAIVMIVAALLGPRWGMYLERQRVFGIDMVVALDVSRSMLAQDIQPNRLEAAKLSIKQQLTERAALKHTNRLALLAFAGSTSLKLPLSTDHLAFRTKLEDITLGSAPRGGTAIAEAIRAATDLFAKSPEQATRIILLFTDGEDHEGGPIEAAKEAFETQGIRTFTIAVGDPARTVGAQVPSGINSTRKPLLHDGQIVFSKVNLQSLKQIAAAGQGQVATLPDLHRLVDAIGGMHKTELSNEERIRHRPQYQWFLTVALILLLLEAIVSERRASVENLPRRVWQQETTV